MRRLTNVVTIMIFIAAGYLFTINFANEFQTEKDIAAKKQMYSEESILVEIGYYE